MSLIVLASLVVLGAWCWRPAVAGALFLAVFEGALRKWVLPGSQETIYFAKETLVIGAYIGFFGGRLGRRQPWFKAHPAKFLLGMLIVIGLMQIANPKLPNVLVGLFGFQAYFGFVPLMFLVPFLFPAERDLRRFVGASLVIALPVLILGPIQFSQPASSVLNRYVVDDSILGIATLGANHARITGTFSYITGYTAFLTLLALVAVVVLLGAKTNRARWVMAGYLGLVLGNLLMTGSRGPLLIVVTSSAAAAVILARTNQQGATRRGLGAVIVLAIASGVAVNAFPEAHDAFFQRVSENDDISSRVTGTFPGVGWAIGQAGWMGYGIGSTHQAAASLVPLDYKGPVPPGAEDEWQRITLEIGPVGFALMILVRILIVTRLWATFRGARGSELQPVYLAALLFTLSSMPTNIVFDHTESIFYWFMAGIGMVVPVTAVNQQTGQATLTSRPMFLTPRASSFWLRPRTPDSSPGRQLAREMRPVR